MSIYLKLRKAAMNYLQIAIAVFGAIITILGLVGTFGSPLWLKNKKNSKIMLILGFICVVGSLVVLIQDLQQQEKQEMSLAHAGILQPDLTTLYSTKDRFGAYPYMEIGDSGTAFNWSGPNGKPLFKIFEDSDLTISQDGGQVKISTNIRGRDGSVAVLENNEWIINPSQMFDRNYNKNMLEVRDNNRDVVLQVRLLNDRIQFQGKFYDEYGNGVAIVSRKELGGGVIEFTGLNHPTITSVIEPIFMNNSFLHFGEIIRTPATNPNLSVYNLGSTIINPGLDNRGVSQGGGGIVLIPYI